MPDVFFGQTPLPADIRPGRNAEDLSVSRSREYMSFDAVCDSPVELDTWSAASGGLLGHGDMIL
jgi:hypothetical protein